jgi:hypothetical protein
MLFNSLSFAIFLPIVFILYWYATKGNYKVQNVLLLISSYFFYSCWDWRFLFLLIFSTLLDYYTGIKMCDAENQKSKKFWFWLSISINLGFLGVFKYYNFFAESFASALANVGLQINPWTLKVILPVGISFYTFHGLSYVIDIYKSRIKAEKNFIDYPYIETTAKTDTLVIPDNIYITIILNESDSKNKKSTEELEIVLEQTLKKININTQKDLSLLDYSSDFKKYFLKGQNVLKVKNYSLLVHDAITAGKVLAELENVGISNVEISKTEYSKAKSDNIEIFVFQGHELLTDYAKYLLEYLKSKFE